MKLLEPLKLMATLALAVLVLAGCSRNEDDPMPARSAPGASKTGYAMAEGDRRATNAPAAPRADGRHLETIYGFSLLVPEKDVSSLQQKHLAECRRLGCEVLSTNLDRSVKDYITAHTAIRIAPESFPAFEQTISAPPSEVDHRGETAEDQTLPLLDAEKRLEVKTLLRDRLTAMLRDPAQKSAADIAAIERQTAEVQGDVEFSTAQRDYLRRITQTVRVDIAYRNVSAKLSGIDFSPVANAVANAARTFIRSLAELIAVAIWLIPWIPVAALVYWTVRRLRRKHSPDAP